MGNHNSGRKSKTLSELPGDWERVILDLGTNGKTLLHVYDAMGMGETAFRSLTEREPHLKEIMTLFKNKAKIHWMDMGQELSNGKNRDGNANAWKFNMQNRVGWHDKVVTEVDSTIKVEHTASDLFKDLLEASKSEGEKPEE